jgi:hypothetical protein
MKMKNKRKRIIWTILGVFGIFILVVGITAMSTYGIINAMPLNQTGFSLESNVTIHKSEASMNGSWWGHNQKKMASIGDTIFSSELHNENYFSFPESEEHPNTASLNYFDGTKFVTFQEDIPTRNAPNVITDKTRNLIYYFAIAPKGEHGADSPWSNSAIQNYTMMYVYNFDPLTKQITLNRVEEIIRPNYFENGQIRAGVDMDSDGNIAFVYGTYDKKIEVYLFDVNQALWSHMTYTGLEDGMMYAYVEMKSLSEFDILVEEDYSDYEHPNSMYFYTKMFSYNEGIWEEKMIVDYRNHPNADFLNNTHFVENSSFAQIDGTFHIITVSLEEYANEIKYFQVDNGELTETKLPFGNGKAEYKMVRVIEVNGSVFFVTINNFGQLTVYDNEGTKQFQIGFLTWKTFRIYAYSFATKLAIMTFPSSSEKSKDDDTFSPNGFGYETMKAKFFLLEKK